MPKKGGNATCYVYFTTKRYPLVLGVLEGKDPPDLTRQFESETARLYRKFRREKAKLDKQNSSYEEARNELMDHLGPNVYELFDMSVEPPPRTIFGTNDADPNPNEVQECLGQENIRLLNRSLEKTLSFVVSLRWDNRRSIDGTLSAFRALASNFNGSIEIDSDRPIMTKVNPGKLEYYCTNAGVRFPEELFVGSRFARTYPEPYRRPKRR